VGTGGEGTVRVAPFTKDERSKLIKRVLPAAMANGRAADCPHIRTLDYLSEVYLDDTGWPVPDCDSTRVEACLGDALRAVCTRERSGKMLFASSEASSQTAGVSNWERLAYESGSTNSGAGPKCVLRPA
jgi:hypothetical protein